MPTKTPAKRTTAPSRGAPKGNKPVPATSKPKAEKKLNECRCGCGRLVKGAFAQGHDARLYGQVLRGEKPESLLEGFAGLQSKLTYARKQEAAKAARKAERASKADASPDQAAPTPDASDAPEPTPKVRRKPSRVSS